MSPAVKYTLGRIGLFLVVALALWPVEMDIFLKLMLAVAFSAALAFFLLRGWRDQMAQQLAGASDRRRSEKERLRAALAGEDQPGGGADRSTDQSAEKPKDVR
ncbi:DUF4229 domain-containing protein [Plantactinospora sp. B5E13]|uniref:DUF4229 domain-containing protein n=1 Tax=unclassified Plantactinospora TaxID=2631981 RepID=UPI00325D949E